MAEGVKYDALLLQGYGFLVPVLGSRFSVSLNISPFSSSMQLSRLVCSAHLSSLLCMLIFSSLSVSNVSSSSFNLRLIFFPAITHCSSRTYKPILISRCCGSVMIDEDGEMKDKEREMKDEEGRMKDGGMKDTSRVMVVYIGR